MADTTGKRIEQILKQRAFKALITLRKAKDPGRSLTITADTPVLFVRLNKIGDALVTTPLITALKKEKGCPITVLCDSRNAMVFKNTPGVDDIIVFEKGLVSLSKLVREINKRNFYAVVDLHDDISTTVSYLISLLHTPFKVALKKESQRLYTHTAERPDPKTTHVLIRTMALAPLLGLSAQAENARITYAPSQAARSRAADFVKSHYPEKRFLLAVNISAGDAARFWGVPRYQKLLQELKNLPVDILLLSSTRDLKHALAILPDQRKIYYTPVFEEFAAMLEQVDFLFSPDTATIHLASIWAKPVFGLYVQYNTTDIPWYPYGSRYDMVVTQEPTVSNILPEVVFDKFIPFLKSFL